MRRLFGRLRWLARIVLLAGILLLAAGVDGPPSSVHDSSVRGRLAALVTRVLPATADDPSSTSASVLDTTAADCESLSPDPLRAAWMTRC